MFQWLIRITFYSTWWFKKWVQEREAVTILCPAQTRKISRHISRPEFRTEVLWEDNNRNERNGVGGWRFRGPTSPKSVPRTLSRQPPPPQTLRWNPAPDLSLGFAWDWWTQNRDRRAFFVCVCVCVCFAVGIQSIMALRYQIPNDSS